MAERPESLRGSELMKRFLLLLALIATTGGALAHDEDPQLRRAIRQCQNSNYWELMEYGLDAVARRYFYE